MKKGLIISREHSSSTSPTANCLKNILEIIKYEHSLTIISYKNANSGIQKDNRIEVHEIYSDSDKILLLREAFLKLEYIKKSKINWVKVTRALFLIPYIFTSRKGIFNSQRWSKNAINYILEKVNIQDYNYILAIGAPFDNVKTGYQLSKKFNIPLYIVEFDLFTYFPTNNHRDLSKMQKNISEEKNWYELAHKVFMTSEMKDVLMESELSKYEDKFATINIPNLVKCELDTFKTNTNDIQVLYAGAFFKDIRNPTQMLELFTEVFKVIPNVKLNIMGTGCEEIIESYRRLWPEKIIVHGVQSKESVLEAISKTNILLNVSNKTLSQVPSKIIEYISSGKPIINIYSLQGDLCVNILKKYELAMSINQNQFEKQDVDNLIEFIKKSKDKTLSYEKIEEEFIKYTPGYVAQEILKSMDK